MKWWIEKVERGNGMHLAKMVVGDPDKVWSWDGGECQPVEYHFLWCAVRITVLMKINVVLI